MEGILFLTNEVGVALSQARQQNEMYQQMLLEKDRIIESKDADIADLHARIRDLREAPSE